VASLSGKVAWVTGAGSGIGEAAALALAREGAAVALSGRRREPLQAVADRIAKAGGKLMVAPGDLGEQGAATGIADSIAKQFGRLDILVNNAGVEVSARLVDSTEEEWRQLLDINLNGCIALTKEALPHLKKPGGVIVNVASALGLAGCVGFSVYSASKAGMIGFTQSLAWEVARDGVRVVAVAPGLVHTPMAQKHVDKLTPAVWAQLEACHPLGVGRAADCAAAICFLASEDARWITGVTLPLGFAHQFPLPIMGE
jgi:NAD(P)-dependent dehydrogenase (short-subunit alcohol dehydrogenase family)